MAGNLYVRFDIVFPKYIPETKKEVLREILKEEEEVEWFKEIKNNQILASMGNVCGVNKKGRKAKRDIITGRPIPPREPIQSFSGPREHPIQSIELPSLQPPVGLSPR